MAYIKSLEVNTPVEGSVYGNAVVYFDSIRDFTVLSQRLNTMEDILQDPYMVPLKVITKCQFCGQWGARECACAHCGGAVE